MTIEYEQDINTFLDHKVRAVWDEANNQWWFSVLDIVGAINGQDDHEKNRNYWKYLKAKLKREKQNEVVSVTTQLRLVAPDGKKRLTVVIQQGGRIACKSHPEQSGNSLSLRTGRITISYTWNYSDTESPNRFFC